MQHSNVAPCFTQSALPRQHGTAHMTALHCMCFKGRAIVATSLVHVTCSLNLCAYRWSADSCWNGGSVTIGGALEVWSPVTLVGGFWSELTGPDVTNHTHTHTHMLACLWLACAFWAARAQSLYALYMFSSCSDLCVAGTC